MSLLMAGVFRKTEGAGLLSMATILSFVVAIVGVFLYGGPGRCILWNVCQHQFYAICESHDSSRINIGRCFSKRLYEKMENSQRFEVPILILFATLGMMMMVSAGDLIALYIGLELQSLSLYVFGNHKA